MTRPKILIVGAGPTGLTAAVELARLGVIAAVIEKRSEVSNLSRAVGIQERSMEIFARSGVRTAIEHEAHLVDGVIFHNRSTPIAKLTLSKTRGAKIWALAQDRTEHHLKARFEAYGGQIDYGTHFTGLHQDERGVKVRTNKGEASYDYVIGADGVGSAVRGALGIAFNGYDLPEQWSIADVDAKDWPNAGYFQGFLLPGGEVCVVIQLEKDRYRVVSSEPDSLAALPVPMDVIHIRRSGGFTISIRQVDQYQKGRVFLAGDAAHCHSPVGGRGMNLGIADAADLAARIVSGDLAGYHTARHREGQHVITLSERARKLIQSQNPLTQLCLRTALRTISALPPLRRIAANQFFNG